jgi:hypothetical protein
MFAASDEADATKVTKTRKQRDKALAARLSKLAKQRSALNESIRALEERRKLRQGGGEEAARARYAGRNAALRDAVVLGASTLASLSV